MQKTRIKISFVMSIAIFSLCLWGDYLSGLRLYTGTRKLPGTNFILQFCITFGSMICKMLYLTLS